MSTLHVTTSDVPPRTASRIAVNEIANLRLAAAEECHVAFTVAGKKALTIVADEVSKRLAMVEALNDSCLDVYQSVLVASTRHWANMHARDGTDWVWATADAGTIGNLSRVCATRHAGQRVALLRRRGTSQDPWEMCIGIPVLVGKHVGGKHSAALRVVALRTGQAEYTCTDDWTQHEGWELAEMEAAAKRPDLRTFLVQSFGCHSSTAATTAICAAGAAMEAGACCVCSFCTAATIASSHIEALELLSHMTLRPELQQNKTRRHFQRMCRAAVCEGGIVATALAREYLIAAVAERSQDGQCDATMDIASLKTALEGAAQCEIEDAATAVGLGLMPTRAAACLGVVAVPRRQHGEKTDRWAHRCRQLDTIFVCCVLYGGGAQPTPEALRVVGCNIARRVVEAGGVHPVDHGLPRNVGFLLGVSPMKYAAHPCLNDTIAKTVRNTFASVRGDSAISQASGMPKAFRDFLNTKKNRETYTVYGDRVSAPTKYMMLFHAGLKLDDNCATYYLLGQSMHRMRWLKAQSTEQRPLAAALLASVAKLDRVLGLPEVGNGDQQRQALLLVICKDSNSFTCVLCLPSKFT